MIAAREEAQASEGSVDDIEAQVENNDEGVEGGVDATSSVALEA